MTDIKQIMILFRIPVQMKNSIIFDKNNGTRLIVYLRIGFSLDGILSFLGSNG